ncbi:FRG domain-containing protein [Paraburkholderia nemoris]|uniref:FRG domain-containing protein n=1 Tax=Paraburkholderia nemoris TaxID=2793076 RepID=UPI0038BA580C
MPAIGQFWGAFKLTAQNGQPLEPAQLQPPNHGPTGEFLLNIDEHRPASGGCFLYRIQAPGSPLGDNVQFTIALSATTNDATRFAAHGTEAFNLEAGSGRIQPIHIPPRNNIPYRIDVGAVAVVQNVSYRGTFTNSWGDSGTIAFWRPEAGERVRDVTKCGSWSEYKNWVSEAGRQNFAFRGQSNSEWQLKTSLHRSGRFDLWHYSTSALTSLQQELEGAAGTSFNRDSPADFARLLALAQHHGFPTPLLDFTFSPYVAAYFAMSGVLDKPSSERAPFVRVYALDKAFQAVASKPVVTMTSIEPTAGVLGISGLRNPRLYAQQGLFLYSNVELVEHFLTSPAYTQGATYLRAVDIPSAAAVEALTDLSYMGISPASLFPGVDGVCLKVKQQLLTGTL